MRKLVGLLLWVGSFAAAFYCFGIYFGTMEYETPQIGYLVGMTVLLLLSGIGRRVFHIKKALVERKGLLGAVLSRINCMRFYFSVVMYTALAFVVYFIQRMNTIPGTNGDGIKAAIAGFVVLVFFFANRLTCRKCGYSLKHDGDTASNEIELTWYSDSVSGSQKVTEYYHCPRCGAQVKMHSKRDVGSVTFK
ncbi:MAG: hypothetical protein J6D21_13150 [Clostridia bacterium]|nr:hypothetical protein [Clostridia bacterium]